jgi:anaerobic selenocysteine-containing dehydrogenase
MWIVGANPIVTNTRGDLVRSALRDHLEFTVTSDFFITPTAAVSDLVLPAQHWLEQDDVMDYSHFWCVTPRKQVCLVGEAKDDREAMLLVARKLGLDEAFPWKTWRDHLEWLVEPSGMSFAEFQQLDMVRGEMRYRKYEQEGFRTPSGKVELYSTIMEKMGLDPLPVYTEPPLSPISRPDLAEDYPYILMTGCKIMPFFHSEGRNVDALRRLHPKPLLEMNPESALKQGLQEGQRVRVSTPYGGQEFILSLDDRLTPDVVHVEHAWWFAEQGGPEFGCFTSNANMLFSHEYFDPITGAEPLKCLLCRVDGLE